MLDPDLEIRGARSSRPLDKGEAVPKIFFRPFGPQFRPKNKGEGGSHGPLSWICHWTGAEALENKTLWRRNMQAWWFLFSTDDFVVLLKIVFLYCEWNYREKGTDDVGKKGKPQESALPFSWPLPQVSHAKIRIKKNTANFFYSEQRGNEDGHAFRDLHHPWCFPNQDQERGLILLQYERSS